MLMDIVLTNEMITAGVFGILITTLTTIITIKVNNYIKRREASEEEKARMQKFYNMQLEAMIFSVLSFGEHREEIKKVYEEKLRELVDEEKFLLNK